MKPIVSVTLALAVGLVAAPTGATDNLMHAGELAHAVDRLGHTGRVLYVAAHPDDENTRLLAYLVGERHLEVAYLSMTRGGGGQNLIGNEQGELLDVIRTEELLAARAIDGGTQRFTRMRDFGYSKRADETLATWGRDEALADVVWVIRTFQPDVIITRFDEQPPNHGHHTASAILAREAFAAAADPTRFPDQLTGGVEPWRTDRLLYNLSTWRNEPVPKDAIELDVGAYDPRRGLGYGELAALSRSQHKSQGFGVAGERGPIIERFVSIAGTRPRRDLLEGLDLGWGRFGPKGRAFGKVIAAAAAALDRDHPEKALPALARAHAALDALPDSPRVRDARADLVQAMASAAGLFLRATTATPMAVPGASLEVSVEIVARGPARVQLQRVSAAGASSTPGTALGRNERKVVVLSPTLAAGAPLSLPYWLEETPLPGRYPLRDPTLVGAPTGPPAITARVALLIAGRTLELEVPVVHAWTDPVQGERSRALLVAPPATVTPARAAIMFPNGRSAAVLLRVRAAREGLVGDVELGLPSGWRASPATQPVSLARVGDEVTVRFEVTPPPGAKAASTIRPSIRVGDTRWSYREDVIDHPHIPMQVILQPAQLRMVPVSLALPEGRIGYVEGSGDTIAEDLTHVGFTVDEIDDQALRSGDLSRYAAIVVGIRAYNVRPAVRAAHGRLMAFVERGGTVVVQYNTNSRLSPLAEPIGPHPFELGRDRITDEKAAMVPVDPKHPLLATPNAITAADFQGWVQERGIYFAAKWDERYQPLFSATDPGESPLLGGTLVTRHGKGTYVYTGLVFFRQLPAGVPGAYRLFANLVARRAR